MTLFLNLPNELLMIDHFDAKPNPMHGISGTFIFTSDLEWY